MTETPIGGLPDINSELCLRCGSVQPTRTRNYIDRTEWICCSCGNEIDVVYWDDEDLVDSFPEEAEGNTE